MLLTMPGGCTRAVCNLYEGAVGLSDREVVGDGEGNGGDEGKDYESDRYCGKYSLLST